VTQVLAVGRSVAGQSDPKLRNLVLPDFKNYSAFESELSGFDACFFCLGVSSAGLSEAAYRQATFDITLAAAHYLLRLNPCMIFIYVSGSGTDSSGTGRIMWARVKGDTENGLLALPFKAAYMLRPGVIQPLHGIRSKTRSYQLFYSSLKFMFPVLRVLFPNHVLTTSQVGQAMLNLVKYGYPKRVLETRDIAAISVRAVPPTAPS
jgi:uncharacterized protein YbjT (DUF2867 family)